MKSWLSLSAIALAAAAIVGAPQLVQAQGSTQQMFFEGDMVSGHGGGPTCVLTSRFQHGQTVVWRVRVQNQTGKALDKKDLKSLAVELPDGQKFSMHYGPHPKGRTDDYFWTTSWKIPANYPTGTLSYKVVATAADGKTQSWSPFKVKPSELTIVK